VSPSVCSVDEARAVEVNLHRCLPVQQGVEKVAHDLGELGLAERHLDPAVADELAFERRCELCFDAMGPGSGTYALGRLPARRGARGVDH
jgi:hypothetical protein